MLLCKGGIKMYIRNDYVYDDENLAFIPQRISTPEARVIIQKYSTNKGDTKKSRN